MKLEEITPETGRIFFCCMHMEYPEDAEFIAIRRRWYKEHKQKGYKAKLLFDDKEEVVGLCQYIPIEHSHLTGSDLMTILCFYVHGYKHGVGIQQGKGYSRFMLKEIEEDARISGKKGVAAWGMDWEINWMPLSFFEYMGYTPTDREDKVVAVWKPFNKYARPPALKRTHIPVSEDKSKVKVFVAANGWCGCEKFLDARKAVESLDDIVDYEELGTPESASIIHIGYVGGIFLDGKPFKPYEPPGYADELRAEIIRLYEEKKGINK